MFSWNSLAFFHDPVDAGNLISGSSTFSKTSLNIWKFMVHVLLKPGLKNLPDILECEVKWALESITMNKASEGDGIPVELFQILKDLSATLNMPANLENSAVATGLEKISFHSSPKRKAMPKKAQTTAQLHSSHTLAK